MNVVSNLPGSGGIEKKLKELEELLRKTIALRADLESYGLVKLADSSAVTDSTGLALSANEKNPNVAGSLAAQINARATKTGNRFTGNNQFFNTYTKSEPAYGGVNIHVTAQDGLPAIAFYRVASDNNGCIIHDTDTHFKAKETHIGPWREIAYKDEIPTVKAITEAVVAQISEQYSLDRK